MKHLICFRCLRVFDALTHKRKYKAAWSMDDALDYIKAERGMHFDPKLVDILFSNLNEFLAIVQSTEYYEL